LVRAQKAALKAPQKEPHNGQEKPKKADLGAADLTATAQKAA
jgi:hypothetical protein